MIRYDARDTGGATLHPVTGPVAGALTGRLHSTESFGTLDGPGIRQVLFFQGCHLRCAFCQNRDTWARNAGRQVTVEELTEEALRYRHYMRSSGGGVTASGGDPILQAAFVEALFRRLQGEGIHTALDTSGVARITAPVERLLEATDLVLLDIKHMDDRRHRDLTGAPNTRTLDFARHLRQRRIPVWIRHVVIPGWTTEIDHAARLAHFLRSLTPIVERVELLPYHEHGRHKWEALGETYRLDGVPTPTAEEMEAIRTVIATTGIKTVVG